ncbi:MAG: hypothetical protein EOO85_22055 [Pedobacter sp.]|nr:MAG: hypothetical protein EOO85_22055 [Pedobacter sp.]
MEQLTLFTAPKSTIWRDKLQHNAIILSQREKEWIEFMDPLPRKINGEMHYIYKPANAYPARIYVFVHGENWRARNKRPMGLFNSTPFLTRPMNSEEIEDHHFDNRMCYRQYESFDKLIKRELYEAKYSNIDLPGSGNDFIQLLELFRNKYIK